MSVGLTWTDPSQTSPVKMDLATNDVLPETTWDALMSNLYVLQHAEHGGLYFGYSSATVCNLTPVNSGLIRINKRLYVLTSVITVGTTGAAANQNRLAYIYDSSGTLTLETSTTAHSRTSTTGNENTEIKTGDETRSLVGQVRMNNSTQFQDSATGRLVRSWFARRRAVGRSVLQADVNTASASFVVMSATLKIEFVNWGDEAVTGWFHGGGSNSTGGAFDDVVMGVDGSVVDGGSNGQGAGGGYFEAFMASIGYTSGGLAEGYHYAESFYRTTGGTFSIEGAAGPAQGATIQVMVG